MSVLNKQDHNPKFSLGILTSVKFGELNTRGNEFVSQSKFQANYISNLSTAVTLKVTVYPSRPVVGTEIQTCRNTKARSSCHHLFSVYWSASLGSAIIMSTGIAHKATSTLVPFFLIISVFYYPTILFKLRHQQAQVQNHVTQGPSNDGEIPLNITRNRKSVSSISWVQLALVACYTPWGSTLCYM